MPCWNAEKRQNKLNRTEFSFLYFLYLMTQNTNLSWGCLSSVFETSICLTLDLNKHLTDVLSQPYVPFPVPFSPLCSLSSLLLPLGRKGHPPPLVFRLCLSFGLSPVGTPVAGSWREGRLMPSPGLSGALMELARLMLSGLSLLSKPLKVSALFGQEDAFAGTAKNEVLPLVSLFGSSHKGSTLDTGLDWIFKAFVSDSL